MTQYNTVKVKLYYSQLNKLKSAIENGTKVTLNVSSNLIGNSNDETNFPHISLLISKQVSKIRKAFVNGSSSKMKFSKTQLSKIVQSGGFLGRPLAPLLKTGLPLIGNVLESLAKSVLILLRLTATASGTDAAINNLRYDIHSFE